MKNIQFPSKKDSSTPRRYLKPSTVKEHIQHFQNGGRINKPTDLWNTDRVAWVDSVNHSSENIQKDFIKRYSDLSLGSIPSPDGSGNTSTHLMGSNGKGYSFPHVVNQNGKLVYIKSEDRAEEYAKKYNEGIQFKNEKQADWYSSNGYKQGTDVKVGKHQKDGDINPKYISPGEPALTKEKKLLPVFEDVSDSTGYPSDFLRAIAFKESSFKTNAKASDKRGKGLIQFDDTTARRFNVKDPNDPQQALTGFTRELDQYAKEAGGNYELALARHHGAKQYKENPDKYRKGKYKDYYDFVLPYLVDGFIRKKNIQDFSIPKRERKQDMKDLMTKYQYNKIQKELKDVNIK